MNTGGENSRFIELVKIQEGSQSTLRDEASKMQHNRSKENDDKVMVDRQTYDLIKQKVQERLQSNQRSQGQTIDKEVINLQIHSPSEKF